jgi:hypothetical protein
MEMELLKSKEDALSQVPESLKIISIQVYRTFTNGTNYFF